MFKMAILGAGAIAHKMSATIRGLEEVEPYIICDTTIEKAEALAKEYGYTKVCSSYEDILADNEVDLVYIAVPHSLHYKFTKIMLEGGKNSFSVKIFYSQCGSGKRDSCIGGGEKASPSGSNLDQVYAVQKDY